jgi:hypothetical protein
MFQTIAIAVLTLTNVALLVVAYGQFQRAKELFVLARNQKLMADAAFNTLQGLEVVARHDEPAHQQRLYSDQEMMEYIAAGTVHVNDDEVLSYVPAHCTCLASHPNLQCLVHYPVPRMDA